MILEVRLFAGLQKYVMEAKSGEPFEVTADDGQTLAELVEQLGIPEREAYVTMVNGQTLPVSTVLKDGERIGIFPPVGGG